MPSNGSSFLDISAWPTFDRLTGFLLPPSVDEWLPEQHLARFVVEAIEGLDLTAMSKSYCGTGSASYHPAPLLGLLVHVDATGVFSSRKLERATHDSVAFRIITADDHPDHDIIATFRRRFLDNNEALFVKVLILAREMGVLKMATVALDGTKIHANAGTTHGFGVAEFRTIGDFILRVLDAASASRASETCEAVRLDVQSLCRRFPI